jgi:glycosyltransferase involved in cell wall biosynthesis
MVSQASGEIGWNRWWMVSSSPSPKRVAVNGRLLTRVPSGIQRYVLEQLEYFAEPVDIYLPGAAHSSITFPAHHRVHVLPNHFPHDHLWEQLTFRRASRHHDVVWSPFSVGLPWCNRLVFTLHDLSFFEEPSSGSRVQRAWYQAVVRRVVTSARRIVTHSEYAAETIRARFALPESQVVAIPLAANPFWAQPIDAEGEAGEAPETPFVLAVGTAARKDLPTLISAVERAKEKVPELRLVVVGRPPEWSGQYTDVVWAGPVPDAELRRLYRSATVFAFASKYEGFGLPVLEAMTAGCPVVTVAATSVPEVAGDAAVLVEVGDVVAFADAIVTFVSQPEVAEQYRAKGLTQADRFSWARTATLTWSVLNQ